MKSEQKRDEDVKSQASSKMSSPAKHVKHTPGKKASAEMQRIIREGGVATSVVSEVSKVISYIELEELRDSIMSLETVEEFTTATDKWKDAQGLYKEMLGLCKKVQRIWHPT